jgi:Na+/melibiose symporter-like transporter
LKLLQGLVVVQALVSFGSMIADITAATLLALGMLFGPIVSGFAVIAVWCMARFDLDRQQHADVLKHRAHRRAETTGESHEGHN